uniref:adenine deaminase n=1 Tax=Ndongobacter massiliensis TaxID=1871025 RepID=UPI000931D615|nr:adenine deaminase C-terminal domain-containing protein [Ndongobacter massiliensis]
MRIPSENQNALIDAAMDRISCDLAICNTKYVNLFTGEIYPATVYVHKGFVVFVDKDDASKPKHAPMETIDAAGRYIVPGLIDSHIHIESTMLTPRNFAKAALPCGVTSIIHDPHEITNVYGERAVRYMHDAALDLPMRQFCDIPSCVPSVPGLETTGAVLEADAVHRLAQLPNVIGLAEVMDFVGVTANSDRMCAMIAAAREEGLYIQGHVPVADPRTIAAYFIGGPTTCHESRSAEEALVKLRAGMTVDARESSISKNVEAIWSGLKELPVRRRLSLCTDDRDPHDIITIGHLDAVLRKAIAVGMDPVEALTACTLHTAEAAHIENLGAVAPGYAADFLLVDDLTEFSVHSVYTRGQKVAEDRKLCTDIPDLSFDLEKENSVNLPELTLSTFELTVPEHLRGQKTVTVRCMTYSKPDSLYAICTEEELPIKDGCVDISGREDLCYVAILNRFGKGNMAHGIIKNFGLQAGADASTISHDSHNLCIVYKDPQSALACARALAACGGGIAAAKDGELFELLPLPVGGLMSRLPAEELSPLAGKMKEALRELGLQQENPLLRIASIALIVIPEVKFSDLGLVDVNRQCILPLFPQEEEQ